MSDNGLVNEIKGSAKAFVECGAAGFVSVGTTAATVAGFVGWGLVQPVVAGAALLRDKAYSDESTAKQVMNFGLTRPAGSMFMAGLAAPVMLFHELPEQDGENARRHHTACRLGAWTGIGAGVAVVDAAATAMAPAVATALTVTAVAGTAMHLSTIDSKIGDAYAKLLERDSDAKKHVNTLESVESTDLARSGYFPSFEDITTRIAVSSVREAEQKKAVSASIPLPFTSGNYVPSGPLPQFLM